MIRIVTYFLILLVASTGTGVCLSGDAIVRLKQAGISDATIQVIMREKIVETAAFSVQEIIDIKNSGMSDETLQMVLEEASFLKDSKTIVYGSDSRPLKFTTAQDLIELKAAGVSDDVLKSIVIYNSRHSSDEERYKAGVFLRNMGIVIAP